jgi:hypothetical protein
VAGEAEGEWAWEPVGKSQRPETADTVGLLDAAMAAEAPEMDRAFGRLLCGTGRREWRCGRKLTQRAARV